MDRLGELLLAGSPVDLTLFAVGWLAGWFLLARPRTLPATPVDLERPDVAVVIPARDEAHQLPNLLGPLVAQCRSDDRILVVDDHSGDTTAEVARRLGADVVTPPPLPEGWRGKPHACWVGAQATDQPILVFLDADVRPHSTLIDELAAEIVRHPDDLVSVQPWHEMPTSAEQPSLLPNVTALMGCGAFTAAGDRAAATVAFGPVLALRRSSYERVGGHADPTIRTMHTEDIGMARAVGRSRLFVGSPDTTTFRMYPGGLDDLIAGWTRSIATGARFTRWWLAVATLAWVWSLSGGWLSAPVIAPLSMLQMWVLGRRAGTVRWWAAVLYPVLVVVFAVVFVRSLLAVIFRRDVAWKGRAVPARDPTTGAD